MNAGYETLIVTFSDPIKVLDNMFADVGQYVRRCGRMGNGQPQRMGGGL